VKANETDIGKNVIFRSACRWGTSRTTRQIRYVREDGSVIVRYGGYRTFQVRCHEIIGIY
jgi:hypothetical protein